MLSLKNINKSFGKQQVLKNISLDIQDAEFIVFLGPSGCGKTTLMRIIAGLDQADSGEIIMNNRALHLLAPKDRNLSMVFQNYALYPHKTIFGNIAFPLELNKLSKSEIQTRVETIAAKMEITQLLKRYPRELSGGQRQRVALARALIREPEIFLLDEPLSNLDAKLRAQMRYQISELKNNNHAIFVYVTHDQIEALSLADRIVLLRDGQIEQVGSPEEIYHKPANPFVASFIGSPATNILKTKEEIIGIRPEYFSLQEDGADYAIEAQVQNIEILGSENLLYLEPIRILEKSTGQANDINLANQDSHEASSLMVAKIQSSNWNSNLSIPKIGEKISLFTSKKNIYFFT